MGLEAGKQGRRRDQQWSNPPGADRNLGVGRRRKRGDERKRDTAADEGTRCRVKIQVAEAGG